MAKGRRILTVIDNARLLLTFENCSLNTAGARPSISCLHYWRVMPSPAPSPDQYDRELDANPLSLSQEDHEALIRAETKALSTTAAVPHDMEPDTTTPALSTTTDVPQQIEPDITTPALGTAAAIPQQMEPDAATPRSTPQRRRGRGEATPPAEPTPRSRLRSKMKQTTRAIDAGFSLPNTHALRQGPTTGDGTSNGDPAGSVQSSVQPTVVGSVQPSIHPSTAGPAQAPQQPGGGGEAGFPFNAYYGPYGHLHAMRPPHQHPGFHPQAMAPNYPHPPGSFLHPDPSVGYYPYAGPGYGNSHFPQPPVNSLPPSRATSSEPSSMGHASGDHLRPSPHPQPEHSQIGHPQTIPPMGYHPPAAYHPYVGPQYGNQHLHYPPPNPLPPTRSHSSEPTATRHPQSGPTLVHPISDGNPTITTASGDDPRPSPQAFPPHSSEPAATPSEDHPRPPPQAQSDHLQAAPPMDGQNSTSHGQLLPSTCPSNDHPRTSPGSERNPTIVTPTPGDARLSGAPQIDHPPAHTELGSSDKPEGIISEQKSPGSPSVPPPQTPPNPAASRSPSLSPCTTPPHRAQISPSTNAQLSGIFDDPALTGIQEIIEKMIDSPTVGRMSKESRQALFKGFKDLDELVKKIGRQTSLSVGQICDRWAGLNNHPNGPTLWNMYQAFFEAYHEQELARLEEKDRPKPGCIPSKATVSACYDRFKQKYGDKKYPEILRAWYSMRQLTDSGDLSNAQRTREFRKFTENMDNLIRNASARLGFEAIFLAVGGIVNQDQNLSYLGGSDATREFFPERYRSTDRTAIGHLRAHVYDRLSKRLVAEGEDFRSAQQADPSTGVPVMSEMPAVVKVEPPSATDTDKALVQLREIVIQKAAKFGVDVMKRNNLAWKTLPSICAKAGIVILNWPEDVPYPCDDGFKKGISSMKQDQRLALLAAFEHSTHPVTFKKQYSLAIPKGEPVIIGVPPPADSRHTHGRRLFLDEDQKTEDRNGPPRLLPSGNPSEGALGKKPSSTSNTRKAASQAMIVVDDNSPPHAVERPKAAAKNPTMSKKRAPPTSENGDELSGTEHDVVGTKKPPTLKRRTEAVSEEDDEEDEVETLSDGEGASGAPKHTKGQRGGRLTKRLRFEEPDDSDYSSESERTDIDTGDDTPLAHSPHHLRSHGPARLSTDRRAKQHNSKGSSKGSHRLSKKSDGQRAKKTNRSTKPTSRADQAPPKTSTLRKPSPPPPKLTPRTERVAEELFGSGDADDGSQTPVAKGRQVDPKGKRRAMSRSPPSFRPMLPPPRPAEAPSSPPRSPTPSSRRDDAAQPQQLPPRPADVPSLPPRSPTQSSRRDDSAQPQQLPPLPADIPTLPPHSGRDDASRPHQLPPWQGGYYMPPMHPHATAYHGPNAPADHAGAASSWQPTAPGPSWYVPPMDPMAASRSGGTAGVPVYGNGFWTGPSHYAGPYGYPHQSGQPAQPPQVGASAQPAGDAHVQGAAVQPQGN